MKQGPSGPDGQKDQDESGRATGEVKATKKVAKTLLEIDTQAIMALAEAAAVAQDAANEQEKEQEPEKQPAKRRVAKTLLFRTDIPQVKTDKVVPGQRQISTKKIAKTLLFTGQDLQTSQPKAPQIETCSSQAKEKVGPRYVAKTMLDHSIIFAQLAKTQHRREEKAIELAREKATEPFKPFLPIECKKNALPCNWTWDETTTNERYRYCALCQQPVYNFAALEIADADAIILKAENRSKFTLYKRSDGKFMTSDCPQAIKRRSDFALLIAGGIVAVVCLLIYMVTLPKPKPKPAPPAVAKSGAVKSLVPAKKAVPGAGHYIAGKGIVMDAPAAAPVLPPPVPAPASPDPDENGQMWEFSSPNK